MAAASLRGAALAAALLVGTCDARAPAAEPQSGPDARAGDATPRAEDGRVRVAVHTPRPGSVVRGHFDTTELAGIAEATARALEFDVVLVIDVSGSTKYPSGIDIDSDGELGAQDRTVLGEDVPNTDPDDSILAAEVMAAKTLLDELEPGRVRVGVVSFAGEVDPTTGLRRSANQADSWVEQPLSGDYAAVRATLERVLLRGSSGGTNMAAGLQLAITELAGLSGSQSERRDRARKIVLLLTDGLPSLPFGRGEVQDPGDIEAVIQKARLAKQGHIKVNAYGLGMRAIDNPIAAVEAAQTTGGLYTAVRRPGDIVTVLSGVSFADIDDVVAVNLTIGEMSEPEDISVLPDGSFRGYVPVRPGRNRIRVSALASDGTRGSTELEVDFRHQELTDAELIDERERVRQRNRELELMVERRRQQAFREAERERALTIEMEPPQAPEAPDRPAPAPSEPAEPGARAPSPTTP
jgi:hypothetical protein